MKTKTSNGGSNPRYSLRKHIAFWGLTFEGRDAVFDHEQGAYYVAYLILHQPPEPIHGMALAIKTNAIYGVRRDLSAERLFRNPFTGKTEPLPSDATLVQRNLCIDDAEAAAALRRTQLKLEAILDDDEAIEPVKAEALRDLEAIYEFQRKDPAKIVDTAEKTVRAVRRAIDRFHENLAAAVNGKGKPNPVLRAFADHIEKCILAPSARYSAHGYARNRAGLAGHITYEKPRHIKWTSS